MSTTRELTRGDAADLSQRIHELDGLRGIAMLMVLMSHYLGEIVDQNQGLWAWWLVKVTIVGRTGVDLFFVLSGVLITGIILDRSCGLSGFMSSFYLRRSLRILPPYFGLMLVWFALAALGSAGAVLPSVPLVSYLTFTQTWWMASSGLWGSPEVSVSWSVSIEEHYYVFVPILLLVIPRRGIPWVISAIALLSAGLRAYAYFSLNMPALFAYVFPLCRLDGLAMGGVVALVIRNHAVVARMSRHKVTIFWAAIGATVFLEFLVGVALHRDGSWHMHSWGHLALALVFSMLLFAVILNRGEPLGAVFRIRPARLCGSLSYSVYLFHPLCLLVMFRLIDLRPRLRDFHDLLLVLGALSGTLLVAGLLRPVEQRLIRYGRRFSY